jgi:hypothetical protein
MAIVLPFSTRRLCVRTWSAVIGDADLRARFSAALPGILTEPVLRHLPEGLRHTGANFDPTEWMAVLLSRVEVGVVLTRDGERSIGFLTLRGDDATGNPASMHVLRKAGFREIGTPDDPDTVSFVHPADDRPA